MYRVSVLLLLLFVHAVIVVAAVQSPATGLMTVGLLPGEGMNLIITGKPSPSLVEVKLISIAANWFAGTFMDLPMDHETIIELALAGSGTPENPASVVKWMQLHPVMTYAGTVESMRPMSGSAKMPKGTGCPVIRLNKIRNALPVQGRRRSSK